jgi:hypothetical protein
VAVTIVAYELADRPAALVVDFGTCSAGWRVGDQEVGVADVLAVAPSELVARLIRKSIAEVRSAAASSTGTDGERLRRLAAEIWREYRQAEANVGEQTTLPGM